MVIRLAEVGVEEARRLECKQDDLLHRVGVGLALSKPRIDKESLLFRSERAAKGEFDEPVAERAHLGLPLFVVGGRSGEGVKPVCHEVGHLDGGEGGGFIPFFGNGRATLIADAAIVRRERLLYHHRSLGDSR